MSIEETSRAKSPAQSLKATTRGQLAMLIAQFLAGMAVSFIGMPAEVQGFPRIGATVLLAFHILVAIGLVVGGIRALRPAAQIAAPATGLAWAGLAVTVVTFAAGVLTMATGSDWWSYLMATGATALLVIYALLYLRSLR